MADVERSLETSGFRGGRRLDRFPRRELEGKDDRCEESSRNEDEFVDDEGLDTDGGRAFGLGKGKLDGIGRRSNGLDGGDIA